MPRSQGFLSENVTFTFSKLIKIERNNKLTLKTACGFPINAKKRWPLQGMPRLQGFISENATFTFFKLIDIERNYKLILKTAADVKKREIKQCIGVSKGCQGFKVLFQKIQTKLSFSLESLTSKEMRN